MRPIRFRPPVHLLAAAAVATAGIGAYHGVDRFVLAKNNGVSLGTDEGTGGIATSTTLVVEPEPTTSTTVAPEPPATSTTVAKPKPTTVTTKRKEYPPPAPKTKPTEVSKPKPTEVPKPKPTTYPTKPPGDQQFSLYCMEVAMPDGVPTIKCKWTLSKAPNFHHYRLTREAFGEPRHAVFETLKWDTDRHYDNTVQPGSKYSYVIEVYDAGGNLIESAGPVYAGCCEGATPKP